MFVALFLCACEPSGEPATKVLPALQPIGDPARGRVLLAELQCNRCHSVPGVEAPAIDQSCVACHRDIAEARFDAPSEVLARWQARLSDNTSVLMETPSLHAANRFRQTWLAAFLLEPFDLRPGLGPTMPRLDLDAQDARDLASALTPPASSATDAGDPIRGAQLLRASACGTCHLHGGQPLGALPSRDERVLAPDLMHAHRLRSDVLVAWIVDPSTISPAAQMPATGLSLDDARDIAAHLRRVERAPITTPVPARLPLLEREVDHEEVESAVFRRICWHCHSDPGYAHGDGGPGNHGGFGFEARGLDLSSYEGISSGIRNLATGRRQSVFRPFELPSGEEVPFLVAALLARRAEEAGAPIEGVRGMPLGMPSLPLVQIQLVETWVAQGYHR